MDYFVTNNANQANSLESQIWTRILVVTAERGGRVIGTEIGGKRPDGSDTSGGRTTRWNEPQQRVDGKWVVVHPNLIYEGTDLAQIVQGMQWPVEAESQDWWPGDDLP